MPSIMQMDAGSTAPLTNQGPGIKDGTTADGKSLPQAPPSPPDNSPNRFKGVETSPNPPKSWKDVPQHQAPFSVKNRYFCYVTKVDEEYCTVQMTDELTGEYAEGEIPRDTIKPDDQDLLHVGAEIVWIFGYEVKSSFRQSSITYMPRFRRVTDERLASARIEIDALMDSIFGPLDKDGRNGAAT
jgi:hypothetical protein